MAGRVSLAAASAGYLLLDLVFLLGGLDLNLPGLLLDEDLPLDDVSFFLLFFELSTVINFTLGEVCDFCGLLARGRSTRNLALVPRPDFFPLLNEMTVIEFPGACFVFDLLGDFIFF